MSGFRASLTDFSSLESSLPAEYLSFISSASSKLSPRLLAILFVKLRPPIANIWVPWTPPLFTTAISLVPPPISINIAENSVLSLAPMLLATANGSAAILMQLRSRSDATVCRAPRCTIGAKALNTWIVTSLPWNPIGFVTL